MVLRQPREKLAKEMDIELENAREKISGLKTEISPISDKSISHRSLLIGAIARSKSCIRNLNSGLDVLATLEAVKTLGANVVAKGNEIHVEPFKNPKNQQKIDCKNSGTTMRLLAGIISSYRVEEYLFGDQSLSKRPMDRIKVPLELMGATVKCLGSYNDSPCPPLLIKGGDLKGINYEIKPPSSQVKSSILLAGLRAEGKVHLIEKIPTRRHTEELLEKTGAKITFEKDNSSNHVSKITLEKSEIQGLEIEITGDPSQAAYFVVLGIISDRTEFRVGPFYFGQARSNYLDVLIKMGAAIEREENFVTVKSSDLRGVSILPEEVPLLIDEIPIIAVAASFAHGKSCFRGLSELRKKESDRLVSTFKLLRAFGVNTHIEGDDLYIEGRKEVSSAYFDPGEDHRMAMAALIMACALDGYFKIANVDCINISDPSFLDLLFGVLKWRTK